MEDTPPASMGINLGSEGRCPRYPWCESDKKDLSHTGFKQELREKTHNYSHVANLRQKPKTPIRKKPA
jgi:hypothetical protein